MDRIISYLLMTFLVKNVQCVTIQKIIDERPELVILRGAMRHLSDDIYGKFNKNDGPKYTFFAPHNDAFKNIPEFIFKKFATGNIFEIDRQELNNIMWYHTVYNINDPSYEYTLDNLGNTKIRTKSGDSGALFFRKENLEQYVNGARIIEGDLVADNGIVHIIDSFLYQLPETVNAWTYIHDHSQNTGELSTSRFYDRMLAYARDANRNGHPVGTAANDWLKEDRTITVFLPTQTAMESKPKLEDLRLLQKVVDAHVIQGTYHENLLRTLAGQQIASIGDPVHIKTFGPDLYVSSGCVQGKIIKSNITVENGVIHYIDNVMRYVYNDLATMLNEQPETKMFYGIMAPTTSVFNRLKTEIASQVPENQMLTVFAPNKAAMDVDFRTGDRILEAMQMHVIQGKLETDMIDNSTVRNTLRNGYTATFTRIEYGTTLDIYVEVNNVKGRIVKGDICTNNGIIHIVDHVIGMPTNTIFEYLDAQPNLLEIRRVIGNHKLQQPFKANFDSFTFFAPNNAAFEKLREDDVGRMLLDYRNQRNLNNVLDRHVILGEMILGNLKEGMNNRQTSFDQIGILREGDVFTIHFGAMKVRVVQRDIRMTNGMVNIVDQVLYNTGDRNSAEWRVSRSHHTSSSYLLVFFTMLTCILLSFSSL